MSKSIEKTPTVGLYASSGFDLMEILSRIHNRKDPKVFLGPVDFSCSFVISNPNLHDCPIVYTSSAFEELTGYSRAEAIGKNCRFLQSVSLLPDGYVKKGEMRRYTDNNVVHKLKQSVDSMTEGQFKLINYKKGGQGFINLVTMIPVIIDVNIQYIVGFQVDLIEQSILIMKSMQVGEYVINYELQEKREIEQFIHQEIDPAESLDAAEVMDDQAQVYHDVLLPNVNLFCISMRGVFLYVSSSCEALFQQSDLVDKNITQICHPGDWVSISRELKSIDTSSDLQFIVRLKRPTGYFWVSLIASLMTLKKPYGKRFIIFTAIEQRMPILNFYDATKFGGLNDFLWVKMSNNGLFLIASPRGQTNAIFDLKNDEFIGKTILDYSHQDDYLDIQEALRHAQLDSVVRIIHKMRHKSGHYVDVETVFFPTFEIQIGFIFARINMLKGEINYGLISADGKSSKNRPRVQIYPRSKKMENMFSVFDAQNSTTWQYELQIQCNENKQLSNLN